MMKELHAGPNLLPSELELHECPNIFYGICIWRLWRPIQYVNVIFLFPRSTKTPTFWIIVLL